MTPNPSFWGGLLSILLAGAQVLAADAGNQPPQVRIVGPPDGAVFVEPSDIMILAGVKDTDGTVLTVEFFANDASLGVVTNRFPGPVVMDPPGLIVGVRAFSDDLLDCVSLNPFRLTWHDAPAGHHVLRVVATDNRGATAFEHGGEDLYLARLGNCDDAAFERLGIHWRILPR